MLIELVKDKVFCSVFDKRFLLTSGGYNIHKAQDDHLIQVQNNLQIIKNTLGVKYISILKQIHGNHVLHVTKDNVDDPHEADASITSEPSLALGILTADCVPVLFSNKQGTMVAAAHCGWRGAKADIVNNVKRAFLQNDSDDIIAFIGPSIQQKSYEVDAAYKENFISDSSEYDQFFYPSDKQEHWMFNLVGFVRHKLDKANILVAGAIDEDTYAMPEKYPSYRFFCHNNIPYSNNILSTIFIKK